MPIRRRCLQAAASRCRVLLWLQKKRLHGKLAYEVRSRCQPACSPAQCSAARRSPQCGWPAAHQQAQMVQSAANRAVPSAATCWCSSGFRGVGRCPHTKGALQAASGRGWHAAAIPHCCTAGMPARRLLYAPYLEGPCSGVLKLGIPPLAAAAPAAARAANRLDQLLCGGDGLLFAGSHNPAAAMAQQNELADSITIAGESRACREQTAQAAATHLMHTAGATPPCTHPQQSNGRAAGPFPPARDPPPVPLLPKLPNDLPNLRLGPGVDQLLRRQACGGSRGSSWAEPTEHGAAQRGGSKHAGLHPRKQHPTQQGSRGCAPFVHHGLQWTQQLAIDCEGPAGSHLRWGPCACLGAHPAGKRSRGRRCLPATDRGAA